MNMAGLFLKMEKKNAIVHLQNNTSFVYRKKKETHL